MLPGHPADLPPPLPLRPPPLPRSRGRRVARGCLLSLAVLVLGTGVGAALLLQVSRERQSAWPAPVPGVRLDPAAPHLAEADLRPDNAVFWLRRIEWPERGPAIVPAAERDRFRRLGAAGAPYPGHEAALQAVRPQFELWDRASACRGGRHPAVDSITSVVSRLTGFLELARLEGYRAEMEWEAGRRAESAGSVARIVRNANSMAQGGLLIHEQVRLAVCGETLRSVRRMAAATGSPGDLALLDGALREARPSPAGLAEAMRYELAFVRSTVRTVYSSPAELAVLGGPDPREARLRGLVLRGLFAVSRVAGSTPETTIAHIDAVYSHLVAALEGPYDPSVLDPVETLIGRRPDLVRAATDDPVGRFLLHAAAPAVQGVWRRAVEAQVAADATRAVIGVRRFQLETGALPGTLADLPGGAPADPFLAGGGPMTLRGPGPSWAICSVGADRWIPATDHGGEGAAAGGEQGGLVFGPAEFR